MKYTKETNQRWEMKSILPLAAMVAAVIGLVMPAMAGAYNLAIPAPGLHLNMQPKAKVHPIIRRAAVPSKKSAHKKKKGSRAGAAGLTTRPRVSSGIPAVTRRPRRGPVAGRQMLPVGRINLRGTRPFQTRNPIPAGKLKESAVGRSAGGFTGQGGFAPRRGGGFAPALGGATSGTPSPVGRARDAIGGNKQHPSGGGGFAPAGSGGAASSQNPDAAGHGGSNVIRLDPMYIYGRRSREHPSGGGGTAGGQGGTHFDSSTGTIGFGDGTHVPGTDHSGTPGTINSDGTVDYSDGTHVVHDTATGETTITHPDGSTTTQHRGDGTPTGEYVAAHSSGGGGGTATGHGRTRFDSSTGTIGFGDGTHVPGTDSSGTPAKINPDGSVDYSNGTHVVHDTATGETTITHPDGSTTTQHRGDGTPTGEYVAAHPSGGGGTAGGQGGTHFDSSTGTVGFGDGTHVPGTDHSGTPAKINPDGSVDYSDGTHVVHDTTTGETTFTHPDGSTTTQHRGDGVPTGEYAAAHPPGGGGGTATGHGRTRFDRSTGTIGFGDGTHVPGTDHSGTPAKINPDGSVDYSDGTHVTHDTATGETTITHPDGSTTTQHRGDGTPTGEYEAAHSSGGKHSSTSSGGKHSSTSSGGKHSSTSSGGKHSSTSSGGKHSSSSSGGKHSSSSSGGKHSSSSGGKHSSSSSGGKHSSSSGGTKSNSKDSSKPDKKSGKNKLTGEGGPGVTSGDFGEDIYNKLHPPGNDEAPSNGGHVRGDVSQPGPGSSGGSGAGSTVRGHIQAGGPNPVGVMPGDQRGSKRLNMVDPDRFGGGPVAPSNSAAEQMRHRGDAVNPRPE